MPGEFYIEGNKEKVNIAGILTAVEEIVAKLNILVVFQGETTAAGAADGSTLICSDLVGKPDYNGNQVVITSGDYAGQARGINGATTGGTLTPDRNFSGQVISGTSFVIIGIVATSSPTHLTVPAADAVTNTLERDVIGNKTSTPIYTPTNNADIVRYLKGILNTVSGATSLGRLTTFTQETSGPIGSNGVNWVNLLDRSAGGANPITKETRIYGFKVTSAGGWTGAPQVRIVDGNVNKIFPFQPQYQAGVDFVVGGQTIFNFEVVVTVDVGYVFQFRSSSGDDGVGQTLTLNNLDVIGVG